MFSYAVKRSSSGAQLNSVSYSVNGTNFTTDNLQPNLNNIDTTWNVYSYDFTGIATVMTTQTLK